MSASIYIYRDIHISVMISCTLTTVRRGRREDLDDPNLDFNGDDDTQAPNRKHSSTNKSEYGPGTIHAHVYVFSRLWSWRTFLASTVAP